MPQYQSFFNYNLARPYPYRWFTPVVIVGGTIFAALFSVINMAANGYYPKTIYTTDPNTTLSSIYWFQKAPWSWAGSLNPMCEPRNLVTSVSYFSTNMGMTYTLSNAWRDHEDGTRQVIPVLPYLNNTLENCTVSDVKIKWKKSDTSYRSGLWFSWADTTASAVGTCKITTDTGPLMVNLSTTYFASPNDNSYLISPPENRVWSMWWGAILLRMYYSRMTRMMSLQTVDANSTFQAGSTTFNVNPNRTDDRFDFFTFTYTYSGSLGSNMYNNAAQQVTDWYNNSNANPNIINEAEGFAKALYSMVLTDLGQSGETNVLTTPLLLQQYLNSTGNGNINIDLLGAGYSVDNIPANLLWSNATDAMRQLGTQKARLFSQYACQIPQQKSNQSMFVAVLVADIVFLQVLWKGFIMVVDFWQERSNRTSNYCEGCDRDTQHQESSFQLIESGLNSSNFSSKQQHHDNHSATTSTASLLPHREDTPPPPFTATEPYS